MSEQVAKKFIEALGRLEARREADAIVSLFAEDCEVGNVVAPEKFHGREGAREFWAEKYRGSFDRVESTFVNVFAAEDCVTLEWVTEGTSADGAPVRYEGVSILETDGELIKRFRAYFDAGALGRQVLREAKAAG
jgi:ketosteroid isomerase-like protein